ncbi:ABC transporter permease [Mycoplasma corogypsi]|uniref:ABC transporter permease n=1 Tax=Mycoplasma corogypsi TaxID=2106 RepID=UPI0038730EFD
MFSFKMLVKRNFKIFWKDRKRVFITLLLPVLVLFVYLFVAREVYKRQLFNLWYVSNRDALSYAFNKALTAENFSMHISSVLDKNKDVYQQNVFIYTVLDYAKDKDFPLVKLTNANDIINASNYVLDKIIKQDVLENGKLTQTYLNDFPVLKQAIAQLPRNAKFTDLYRVLEQELGQIEATNQAMFKNLVPLIFGIYHAFKNNTNLVNNYLVYQKIVVSTEFLSHYFTNQNTFLGLFFMKKTSISLLPVLDVESFKNPNITFDDRPLNVLFTKKIIDFFENEYKFTQNSYTDSFLLISLLSTTALTTSVTLSSVIVDDNADKILTDLTVTPVKKSIIRASYLIFNVVVNIIISSIILLISFIFLVANKTFNYSFDPVLLIWLAVCLACVLNSILFNFVFSYVKSKWLFNIVSISIASIFGFVIDAFVPLHYMPKALAEISRFLPMTQATQLIRWTVLSPLSYLKTTPANGSYLLFDIPVNGWEISLYIISWILIFIPLNFLLYKTKKYKKLLTT